MLPADAVRFLRNSFWITGLLALLIACVIKIWPSSELLMFEEDGIVEDASALGYAIGAVFGFVALTRSKSSNCSIQQRIVLWIIPILSLVCFLDEISWGARIFSLHMPEMSGGGQFDGVHDIVILTMRWLERLSPEARLAIYAISLAAFAGLAFSLRKSLPATFYWLIATTERRCLCAAVMLLALAVVLDLGHGRILSGIEEYSEMCASGYMALAGWAMLAQRRRQPARFGVAAI
jgi:hypothetical protein